ncbi:MAG: DUF4292 domain-containing protein [Bacteroidales bacterium]|nr:DUF4292 domain-containing protein [Bacteroidales bacterium]
MTVHHIIGRLALAAAVCVALMTQSCSSTRRAASTPSAPVAVTAANLTSVMAASYGQWQDLYVPFKLRLESPARFSCSGRATMVRGQSLHMSLRVFGMEVAVVHADKETAWLLDKIHRYVCAVPLSSLTARTGIGLKQVQDIMLGRAFFPGYADLAKAPFDVEADGAAWSLTPRERSRAADWSMTADADGRLTSITVTPAGHGDFVATFTDFVTTFAGACAADVAVSGSVKGKTARAGIAWDMDKAQWNTGRDDSWSVPADYKEISPEQLIEILKQL